MSDNILDINNPVGKDPNSDILIGNDKSYNRVILHTLTDDGRDIAPVKENQLYTDSFNFIELRYYVTQTVVDTYPTFFSSSSIGAVCKLVRIPKGSVATDMVSCLAYLYIQPGNSRLSTLTIPFKQVYSDFLNSDNSEISYDMSLRDQFGFPSNLLSI